MGSGVKKHDFAMDSPQFCAFHATNGSKVS